MASTQPAATAAQAFAANWVARNIEPGPFSCDDPAINVDPIRSFRSEAAEAGLTEADLEQGIGAVPAFVARAYTEAAAKWRADQDREEVR